MLGDQLRCLFLFYANPRRAASVILDRGKLWFAVLSAVAVTFAISTAASAMQSFELNVLFQSSQQQWLQGADGPASMEMYVQMRHQAAAMISQRYFATGLRTLLLLAIFFAPFCVLVLAAWDHLGGGGTILFRDYAPALCGLLFAWSAAHLPLALLWWSVSPAMVVPLQWAGLAAFVLLSAPVLSTVTGGSLSHAAVAAVAGLFIASVAGAFLARSGNLLYMLASPWVIYFLYQRFNQDMQAISGGLSERQNFKRQLELATLNPHDADAHYQLGLLYAQRRLQSEAEQSFRRALEIDKNEPEYLFQLGRILSRQQGRSSEAKPLLARAAELDPKLASYEVWREWGAVALASGETEDALRYLSHFVAMREYDPEGLVLFGQALRAANRAGEARAAFQQAIEAAAGTPKYRRREVAPWESLARQELRTLQ